MPVAIVNSFLPVSSDLTILGRQITLKPADQRLDTLQVRPSHVVLSSAEYAALQALDVADVRRVRLGLMEAIQLEVTPGGEGFTTASQAALAAALAPRTHNVHLGTGI